MQTTIEIASAAVFQGDQLAITVAAEYSVSLYRFLRANEVACSPPSTPGYVSRVYLDPDGSKVVQHDISSRVIEVVGTIEDFELWITNWVPSK